MVPQYLETNGLRYARFSFIAFMTERYGALSIDELAAFTVLCNRIVARNSNIALMQLLLSETIYAKPDGSGYDIPKQREILEQIQNGTLDPYEAKIHSDIKYVGEGKFRSDEMRAGWRLPEISTNYLIFIQDTLNELKEQGWTLSKLLSVANKYPEMQAALKEPDLRVWDDMHLLEASPDIPNLGELTEAQKELKYYE